MQRWLIILSLLVLTGCNSSLVQLQKFEPIGTLYQTHLAREYLEFAEAEADQYDWYDSSYFARKGLKLAQGKSAGPEILHYWDIDKEAMPTLMQAREYLTESLTTQMKENHPKEAARAQFLFDCWVEQQEELWQESHIAYCREHFYSTLDGLFTLAENDRKAKAAMLAANTKSDTPVIPKPTFPHASHMVANTDAENMDPAINLSDYADHQNNHMGGEYVCVEDCPKTTEKRTLYFGFASSKLSDRVKRVLNNLSARLKDVQNYEITLNGYADRVGKEEYNMQLSRKRALAVKKELVALGLNADSIMVYAFGEVHGLLDTEDGVPESENRAVEIVLQM